MYSRFNNVKTFDMQVYCTNCGSSLNGNESYCSKCGFRIIKSNSTNKPTSVRNNINNRFRIIFLGIAIILIVALYLFPKLKSKDINKENNSENFTEKIKIDKNSELESIAPKEEQDSQATSQYENPDDVVGVYADMCPGMTTGTITISKTGAGYLFKETFTGGRKAYTKSLMYENKGGKHYFFIIPSEAGDYYVLEKNGDLSSYDSQGYISYASRKK
jgi:hypothetical protein